MQLCGSLNTFWHCLSLGLEWKLTFSSPMATSEFSKFAGILSVALSQQHFRIWNSSTGIPSPPLALFVVMLPKAHLTSHSRMSGMKMLTGDWNAKVWSQGIPGVTGKFALGVQNEAGQKLIEFCQENALVIANTLFQQHVRIFYTWITRWSIPKSDWLYSLQPVMENLYTVSKNKT